MVSQTIPESEGKRESFRQDGGIGLTGRDRWALEDIWVVRSLIVML